MGAGRKHADRQNGPVSSDGNREFLHQPSNGQGCFADCQLSTNADMLTDTKG
jgi:hypothetical protein